ncbi:MAG TPA: DUF4403 family protein [Pseudomonadota bacterium]|nr:DUF4403 family protein [Pseudomonadota bacterium]
MKRMVRPVLGVLLGLTLAATGCTEALYPPRPQVLPGPALADPPNSRVNMHISLTESGLRDVIEATVPQQGEVPFSFLGQRKLAWKRTPIELRFNNAASTIGVKATITAQASVATNPTFTITLTADVQPALGSDYVAQLQNPQVQVQSDDKLLKAAEWSAGALSLIRDEVEKRLRELRINLRPLLADNYEKLAKPVSFPVGDASACVKLGVQSIEAGPTVLSGGFEKDLSLVVAPSVTLPCSPEKGVAAGSGSLPPLHNVASIPSGPFEVTIPIAATYPELQKAMKQAFTDGKLHFDPDYPELYLEKPELYASGGRIVTKLHLNGYVKKGFKISLEGDLFMSGSPEIVDNQLSVPNLEPTIETSSALLKLKTSLDAEKMKKEIRQALRLDIGSRLQAVRDKVSKDLVVKHKLGQNVEACVKADIGRVEVSGLFAHDAYLRMYVKVAARAAAYLPCPH